MERTELVRRLVWSGDRVRVIWRLLVFLALFALLSLLAVVIAPPPADLLSPRALVWQGGALLVPSLLAGWLALGLLERRPPSALGFGWSRRTVPELGVGLAIGAGVVAVVVAVLAAFGALGYVDEAGSVTGWLLAVSGALALFALPAAAEEALFRGYGFQVLVEGIGPAAATVAVSAAFALAHGANPNVGGFGLLNIFLAGVLLSVAYLRTGSLWLPTAVHLGWNWAIGGPFDLPVSGLDLVDAPLYDARIGGAAWVTGGAFGPEGGLAGTVGFGLALLAVWRWTRGDGGATSETRTERGVVT